MRNIVLAVAVGCMILGTGLGVALANKGVGEDEPAIMVSPSMIVLAKVSTVTVHSNIPVIEVEVASVRLDGAEPTGVGADSLGHLVAKFAVADLDLAPGTADLTLTGVYKDGMDLRLSDTVGVK